MPSKPIYLLVHGAWYGGWCWNRVRPQLEAVGASVFSPTLTGLGERAHLRDPVPSLETHIRDIQGVIEAEELRDVVLVGHSYAGMVVTAVADRMKDRIRRLVYLDAAVPSDGNDFATHIPGTDAATAQRRRAAYRDMAAGGEWLPPVEPPSVGVTDPADEDWLRRRATPHPLRTWLEPVRFTNGGHVGLRKTYVMVTDPPTTIMGYPVHGEAAKRGGEWTYREIATGHNLMVTEPEKTTDLLIEAGS